MRIPSKGVMYMTQEKVIELGKQTAEFEMNGWMILMISGIILFCTHRCWSTYISKS